MSAQAEPRIPLPKGWKKHVRSSLVHVISLAQFAVAYTRGWAANSINPRLRQKSEMQRLTAIVAMLREEIRIKDARMARISPHQRPQYQPVERMAILELRAAQGWSSRQTAKSFLVTDATIASWLKRIDEDGPDALVQLREVREPLSSIRALRGTASQGIVSQHGQGQNRPGAQSRRPPSGCFDRGPHTQGTTLFASQDRSFDKRPRRDGPRTWSPLAH